MIEPLLLAVARVSTFRQQQPLTNASGFFFERDERLFLVTSRHVVSDAPAQHFPDRLEIELHIDAADMAKSAAVSIPLFREGAALWRQGVDAAGEIDVAVIEIERSTLPVTAVFHAFSPAHLCDLEIDRVEVGSSLLIVGFPLGFKDTLHHMPVVRRAALASAFGLRFNGEGYFLTDARTHRGTSGAPVVLRAATMAPALGKLQLKLMGVHSARVDAGSRDREMDEALGLNTAWYADILLTLTEG